MPEALSKGVIDGTTIPWEVTKALKVPELVEHRLRVDELAAHVALEHGLGRQHLGQLLEGVPQGEEERLVDDAAVLIPVGPDSEGGRQPARAPESN